MLVLAGLHGFLLRSNEKLYGVYYNVWEQRGLSLAFLFYGIAGLSEIRIL